MLEENLDTPGSSNADLVQTSATTVNRSAIKPSSAARPKCVGSAPKKVITTALATRPSSSMCSARALMSRLAEIARSSTPLCMSSTLRMIQLNVRKRGEVHDSLMNDKEIRDAAVLAIQEPQARIMKGCLLTTPMGHHKWTKMVPPTYREGRWAIRSMLSDQEWFGCRAGAD